MHMCETMHKDGIETLQNSVLHTNQNYSVFKNSDYEADAAFTGIILAVSTNKKLWKLFFYSCAAENFLRISRDGGGLVGGGGGDAATWTRAASLF